MNSKQRQTLQAIFKNPVATNIDFKRIESLLLALGAELIEGDGSRLRFVLNGVVATFHRPHPNKKAKPYQVRDVRNLLTRAGVKP